MKQSKDAQILDLNNRLNELTTKTEDLEKKLKNSETSKDSWYRQAIEQQKQLDAIHDLLDILPDPIARQTGTEDTPSYERKTRTVMERLVAYLVRR